MLLVILVLSFLVLIHEWGHYIAAKRTGVHVEEFGFGYPPRLFTLFKRKGTEFTLNALPFGGFVRLAGDEAETFEKGSETAEVQSEQTSHDTLFANKPRWQRLIVIYAGALMNVFFGVVAFAVIYTNIGIPEQLPHPKITEVIENSPAKEVGFEVGDEVLQINKKPIDSSTELIASLQENQGQRVEVLVKRGEQSLTLSPYVRKKEEIPENEGAVGIALSDMTLKQYPMIERPFRGAVQGMKDSLTFAVLIVQTLGSMVQQLLTQGKVPTDISGPIGIVHVASKTDLINQGWIAILNFAALISINLGVMNVLPIPALDGGRAMFIVLESVIGKKRRILYERYANSIGMALLLLIFLLISIKDVTTIFRGL